MKLKKIKIIAELAHFKVPMCCKVQRTYLIPQPSTIVGVLKSIFGEGINDFKFGYTIKHKGITTEFTKIFKEVNAREKGLSVTKSSGRFLGDNIYLENLIEPEITIYTDIKNSIKLHEPLVLGKTNYLAKITNIKNRGFEEVELNQKLGTGYNQYTSINIGEGMIERVNTLTEYSKDICAYRYKTKLVRNNSKFEYKCYFDEEDEEMIYIWNWKDGEMNEVR